MEEDELIALVDEIPAGRLGKAEEVADLAYHLGYKESYLTGQIIGLDGGGFKKNVRPWAHVNTQQSLSRGIIR